MRALAIVFVVLSHVPIASSCASSCDSSEGYLVIIRKLYSVFFQNGTVVFLFISGYLFVFLNKNFNYHGYLLKKIKYVITPYLIVASTVFILRWIKGFDGFPVYFGDPYEAVFKAYIISIATGSYILTPLWFIPMISLFFITAPIIKWLVYSRVSFFVLITCLLISVTTARPWGNANPVLAYIHFFGIYFLGCWLAKQGNKADETLISRPAIYGLAMLFGLTTVQSYYSLNPDQAFSFEMQLLRFTLYIDWSVLQKIFFCLMTYGLSFLLYTRSKPLVKCIADYSFGVFFIHGITIGVMTKLINLPISFVNYNEFLYLPFGVMIYLITHALVHGIRFYVNEKSRYIIGC